MVIMLASDICRHIIRHQPKVLLQSLQEWSSQSDELVISSITYAELVAGALLAENREKHMQLVAEFCERLDDIIAWDAGAVDEYAVIQTRAMVANDILNMNDAMLAAHALSLDAKLLSMSNKSFARISDLNLQVWD